MPPTSAHHQLSGITQKADGDPDLAHTLRNREERGAANANRAARYHGDEEYRASVLTTARAKRLVDYRYQVFKATRGNARTRGLTFELTREAVADMLETMTCSVTGMELLPEWDGKGRNPWWPSLDQIDPCGGYVASNIRVVSWAYNVMRGQLSDQTVKRYCHQLLSSSTGADIEAGKLLLDAKVARASLSASLLGTWRSSARARGHEFNLSRAWLDARLSQGVCAVTGLSLTWDKIDGAFRRPLAPSADRIDVTRGYTEDNVRVVCSWYNYARQDWDDDLVYRVAEAVLAS